MGLVELKCKSCGANLEISDEREFFFCEYCGAKLTHEKIYHEVSGTVKIDGIAGVDDLIERALILLKNNQYAQSSELYERILEISPKCAEAYWGKFLSENFVNDPAAFIERAEDITENENYKMAVAFSEGETKNYYMSIGEQAKAAYEKYVSKTKTIKNISRIALYISFPLSILMLISLIYISGLLKMSTLMMRQHWKNFFHLRMLLYLYLRLRVPFP